MMLRLLRLLLLPLLQIVVQGLFAEMKQLDHQQQAPLVLAQELLLRAVLDRAAVRGRGAGGDALEGRRRSLRAKHRSGQREERGGIAIEKSQVLCVAAREERALLLLPRRRRCGGSRSHSAARVAAAASAAATAAARTAAATCGR